MIKAAAASFAIALGVGLASTAWTQTTPGASVTESQARTHLEAAGLQNIRDLTMQNDGTWRAQVSAAQGNNVQAVVDAQGNIILHTGVPVATGGAAQPQTAGTPEDQARRRLEAAGLRNIRGLTMQNDGTWRAQVTTGVSGNVQAMVDGQGNVRLNSGVAPAVQGTQAQPPTPSLAESQARSRLEAAGLQNIRDLTMQNDGTWRAQVTAAQGSNVQARVDAQGNVTLQSGVATPR